MQEIRGKTQFDLVSNRAMYSVFRVVKERIEVVDDSLRCINKNIHKILWNLKVLKLQSELDTFLFLHNRLTRRWISLYKRL